MYAKRRYRMKGMSVPIRNWIMRDASCSSDAQSLELAASEDEVEHHPGEQDGGEHVGDQSDDQRHGETLDRTGAELEQEQRADDRRQVRVENGAEGAVVAQLDRLADAALVAQLLANALEDQHVGVDRHAHREHQAGDARKREGGAEAGEAGDDVE